MTTVVSQDQANTLRQQAETIRVLTEVGFDKTDVVEAVTVGDLSKLKVASR